MAVRLNKALKELNVGINTVADFLQKKGMALQDATPNAKITDEQYGLLKKEFGEDMKQNAFTKQKIQTQKEKEQQEKKERQQAMRDEKERQEKEKAAKKQQFKIVGNINDMKKPADTAANEAEKTVASPAAGTKNTNSQDSAANNTAVPTADANSSTPQTAARQLRATKAPMTQTRRETLISHKPTNLPNRHRLTVWSRTRRGYTTSPLLPKPACSSSK